MLASNNRCVGLLYLAPALLFVAVFVFYPLSQLVYMSMTSESLLGGGEFVGFDNYLTRAATTARSGRRFWFTRPATRSYHHPDPDRARLPAGAARRRQPADRAG